jgi:hypothetical protein
MKSIHTEFETWESIASDHLAKGRPFELIGFDLTIPQHSQFWNKVKATGKFHAAFEPNVKVTFMPAS